MEGSKDYSEKELDDKPFLLTQRVMYCSMFFIIGYVFGLQLPRAWILTSSLAVFFGSMTMYWLLDYWQWKKMRRD